MFLQFIVVASLVASMVCILVVLIDIYTQSPLKAILPDLYGHLWASAGLMVISLVSWSVKKQLSNFCSNESRSGHGRIKGVRPL
jgi:hypothetical protein